ncbi:MAG: transglutaminase-like domain-containing protein [Planctomycetota bacterium]|jgi:hypothetical protein
MAYRLTQITTFVVSAVLCCGTVAGERTHGLSDEITSALERAGNNKSEILSAIDKAPEQQRQGMEFLIANMPEHDLKTLSAEFLLENTDLAYRALEARPWADRIPTEIFLNNILPYANVNERRDAWRKDFHDRFGPLVTSCKSPAEAGELLNRTIFKQLNVKYSRRRPKPDQSPHESMEASVASCTGLSILLIDACRAVGVPARFVGTPLWADRSGNHSWVEIWDGGWHFTGAAEPGAKELDHGWFVHKASMAKHDLPRHAIYAVSYKKTPLRFPLVWNRSIDYVSAFDVTDRYTQKNRPLAPGKSRISIRIFDHRGGNRVAAKVTIRSVEGRTIVFEGTSKDERFDFNDNLVAQVDANKKYRLEATHENKEVSRVITVGEQQVFVSLDLSDKPSEGSN